MITHEYVLDTYDYDPITGIFVYKKSVGCRKKGSKVGWYDSSTGNTYVLTKIQRESVKLHRLAYFYMTGVWPDVIDHINGNTTDNRWVNLRNVNSKLNCRNTKLMRHNASGIHGVSRYKGRTWQVYINAKPRVYLGYHDDFFEACCVRKSAEINELYHQNHGRR